MNAPTMITALCTPLTEDEQLHHEGLETHIQDQLDHGINGLLAAGTMGVMQLLTDKTYLDLVKQSVRFNAGRAELLVGVGETSFVRTRDKIKMVDSLPIDGVVIISPYCFKFRQQDLIHYFSALADLSDKPVYLYDLPQMTGTKLELSTVFELARHPNIHGVKCSDQFATTRPLLDARLEDFRVIVAQPLLLDMLLKSGVREHLDGVYGFVPHWTEALVMASRIGDWRVVSAIQKDIADLLTLLQTFPAPLISSVAELLRLRGIPGNIAPAPLPRLTEEQCEQFAQAPIIQKAVAQQIAPLMRA